MSQLGSSDHLLGCFKRACAEAHEIYTVNKDMGLDTYIKVITDNPCIVRGIVDGNTERGTRI